MMSQFIIDLSNEQLSKEGYNKLVTLLKHLIYRYNWPKQILDEAGSQNSTWDIKDVVSFAHQFIAYIFKHSKLKNVKKIPNAYVDYYFHQIIITYVASKVAEKQREDGVSYETVRRIIKTILPLNYLPIEKEGRMFWGEKEGRHTDDLSNDTLKYQVSHLPKIRIKAEAKQYKPLVKRALSNIYSLTSSFIEEDLLIKLTYSLFDQSVFKESEAQEIEDSVVDEKKISESVNQILREIDKNDVLIIREYFFSKDPISLTKLSSKYQVPKSTVHYKISQFKKLLRNNFNPVSDFEGIQFLEILHEKLDEYE
jgi:hypothetical protein